MKAKMGMGLLVLLLISVLTTGVSTATIISDEELNSAYDARLQASGVQLDTMGLTLSEQVAKKKQWYEEFYLNKSYDYSLNFFDIEMDTTGLSAEEQLAAKRDLFATWYEHTNN